MKFAILYITLRYKRYSNLINKIIPSLANFDSFINFDIFNTF